MSLTSEQAPGRTTEPVPEADLRRVREVGDRVQQRIEQVISGKPEVARLALVVLLAEGHLLVEDVPGVGKTTLAKSMAKAMDCSVRRIQFTPDLLPGDVTGVSVYDLDTKTFHFRPGGVFANVVIGDEINRASPKTQSAMLECMEERQVTVDGTTYALEQPFIVVATQNPTSMKGLYPLPEAQLDRFMARTSMGYPSMAAEVEMLDQHGAADPLASVEPACTAEEMRELIAIVGRIHVSARVREYVVALAQATRSSPELQLGASPRATLHLLRAARSRAALAGRDHVLPDDVAALAPAILTHRLAPSVEATGRGRTLEKIVSDLVASVPADRL